MKITCWVVCPGLYAGQSKQVIQKNQAERAVLTLVLMLNPYLQALNSSASSLSAPCTQMAMELACPCHGAAPCPCHGAAPCPCHGAAPCQQPNGKNTSLMIFSGPSGFEGIHYSLSAAIVFARCMLIFNTQHNLAAKQLSVKYLQSY